MKGFGYRLPSRKTFMCIFWVALVGFINWSFIKFLYLDLDQDSSSKFHSAHDTLVKPCVHPKLDLADPTMMNVVKKVAPKNCSGNNWVYIQNGTIRFTKVALKENVTCDLFQIERNIGDHSVSFGNKTKNISDGFQIQSDFSQINCQIQNGSLQTSYHAGISYQVERAKRNVNPLSNGLSGMSIVVLGFDSMSRMSWLRRLTKTRNYFKNVLGAVELEQHNILGDGTTAVMLPMLTGRFEWELPECRRGFKGAKTMDTFPFLWTDMKAAGYLTSWANADPFSAPFNYRMLGFKEQPTDFYFRPFMLLTRKNRTEKCIGSRRLSDVWFEWFKDIFRMYPSQSKFLLHFITDFSHDDNNHITALDDELYDTVHFLIEGDYLKNALLILMGDHGARYGSNTRNTFNGKMEERLPYFSLLFPKWFKDQYPQAMANLETNSHRLTTPFDIYETFRDFLHFGGTGKGSLKNRGISLFKEIPYNRTCEHAGITAHWCACLDWQAVDKNNPLYLRTVKTAIATINSFTEPYRKYCARLSVLSVDKVFKFSARNELLRFQKADTNGGNTNIKFHWQTPKYSDEVVYYLSTFYTNPGGGHFETTLSHRVRSDKLTLDKRSISRINAYGDDPHCILDKSRDIRQYCKCLK